MDKDIKTNSPMVFSSGNISKFVVWITLGVSSLFVAHILLQIMFSLNMPMVKKEQPMVMTESMTPEQAAVLRGVLSQQPASMTQEQKQQLEASMSQQPASMTPEQKQQLEALVTSQNN